MQTTSITARRSGVVLAAAIISTSLILWSQESSPQLSPRELYYREPAPEQEKRAPVAPAKKHAVDKETGVSQKTVNGSLVPQGPAEEGTGANSVEAHCNEAGSIPFGVAL